MRVGGNASPSSTLRSRRPQHGWKLHAREPGGLGDACGSRLVGEGDKPKDSRARLRGVGRRCSTCEAPEQNWATGGGRCGGKIADQGERSPIQHTTDTGRGTCVTRFGGRATSSKSKEGREVHCSASPCHDRIAAGQFLRIEAGGCSWSRWCDVEGVRREFTPRDRRSSGGPAEIGLVQHETKLLKGPEVRAHAMWGYSCRRLRPVSAVALAPWVEQFIGECGAFPAGSHDDQVDAWSQAPHVCQAKATGGNTLPDSCSDLCRPGHNRSFLPRNRLSSFAQNASASAGRPLLQRSRWAFALACPAFLSHVLDL